MKIKKGNWIIDTRSLFRVKWEKYYPVLIVHEKFEKIIKWVIRVFTLVGIALSVYTLPWFLGLGITLILIGIDYLLENVIFLYTTMVIQKPPNFEITYGIWFMNLFFFPNYEEDLPIFCMVFSL
jgi:hypothetical protein